MCGFVGVLLKSKNNDIEDNIRHMTNTLEHRGPDDVGVWSNPASNVFIGHRRLSVIDTSESGHQPMESHCGRYVIAFNGEIYNNLDLKGMLYGSCSFADKKTNFIKWHGHSDTEILLECIAVWGVANTVKKAVGMFSFALWDSLKCELILVRDRFGEKPMYYGWSSGSFLFGSELKAIKSFTGFNNSINRDALSLYFQYCVVPSPHSIYNDIFKLEPGNILTFKLCDLKDKKVNIEVYWSISDIAKAGVNNTINNERESIIKVDSALRKSVLEQSISDVPLGAFLSGGIDSSLIVSLMQSQSMQKIQTFTVGFDEEEFDESRYASKISEYLGTCHNEIRVTANDALSVVPKIPALYDEPFSDSSQIPTYLICKAARQKVTVALSGDAGDELFGGYNRYFWGERIWSKIDWIPLSLRRSIGLAAQNISVESWDSINNLFPKKYSVTRFGSKVHKMAYRMETVESIDDLYRSLVSEWGRDSGLVLGAKDILTKIDNTAILDGIHDSEHRMMLMDSLTYLPDDILTKFDRASMGVSLETRSPFLSHHVAELAWSLPLEMKIRDGKGKWILRKVLNQYIPNELIDRPKSGFGIPIGEWLRQPLREWAESLINPSRLDNEGYLKSDIVHQIWQEHLSGKYDWSARLWSILMFQSWLESQ